MSTLAATPCFPLAETWWLPRLQRLAPFSGAVADNSGIAEAAPLYGAAPALAPGFCACLAEAGRQAALCLLPDGVTLLLLEFSCPVSAHPNKNEPDGNGLASWAFCNPSGIFCFTKNGGFRFTPPDNAGEAMDLRSPWVNLDDRYGLIGIYGGDTFRVFRAPEAGCLNRDEFSWLPTAADSGTVIDRGSVLIAGCPVDVQNEIFRSGQMLRLESGCSGRMRAVYAVGRDGVAYIFASCFAAPGGSEGALTLPSAHWRCLAGEGGGRQESEVGPVRLRSGECRLWVVDGGSKES